MRVLIQRVKQASVEVDSKIIGSIETGLCLFVGVEESDSQVDIDWLTSKVLNMRIFPDGEGKMNNSVLDVDGEIIVVSQFTLHASTKKGNRPSFIRSAPPEFAENMFKDFVSTLAGSGIRNVQTGIFGADMKVGLINDGPVTIWLDSAQKE